MSNFFIAMDNSEIVIQASYDQIERALEKVGLTAERYKQQEAELEELRKQQNNEPVEVTEE